MQFIKANPKSARKYFLIKKSPHALYSYAFAANNSQFYNDRVAPDEDDAAVRYLPVRLFLCSIFGYLLSWMTYNGK